MGFVLGDAIAAMRHGCLRRVSENVEPLEKRALPQWATQP